MRWLTTLLLLVSAATPPSGLAEPAERARVCLALSGGGARGMAHIGVLKALEELQIPVDCIAGASMGSLVGGLYASGISASFLEGLIQVIDWQEVLAKEMDWEDRRLQDRQEERRFFLDLGLVRGEKTSITPAGVLAGQQLQLLLRRLTAGLDAQRFDDLRIPFRAVATDINNAESFVFDHGDLALALRASMAIPLIFEPVRHEGRVLVDGGILNNLPVDVARDMGADLVIAVNISSPFGRVDESSSLFNVAYQSIDASLIQNTIRSLSSADLVIAPEMGTITAADFQRGPEMIEAGYQAVMDRRIFLDALRVDTDRWAELREQRSPPQRGDARRIDYVEFSGNERTATARLRAQAEGLIGERASFRRLEQVASRIMALESFQTVDYQLVEDEGGRAGVRFRVTEKPWGPNYLAFGLEVTSDLDVATDVTLTGRLRRLNLNRLGGEWITDVSVGTRLGLASELYQPLDVHERSFLSLYASADRSPLRLFRGNDQLARYEISRARAGLGAGLNWGDANRLSLGAFVGVNRGDLEVGDPALPDYDDDEGGWLLHYQHDSLNQEFLSTDGAFVDLSYTRFDESLGAEADYDRLDLHALWRRRLGSFNTLHLEAIGRWIEDDNGGLPDSAYVTFGGLGDLAGFPSDGLLGTRGLTLRAGTLTDVTPLELPLLGPPRILALLHAGEVWSADQDADPGDLRWGATAGLTMDLLGAVLFTGLGYTQDGELRPYLQIGKGL